MADDTKNEETEEDSGAPEEGKSSKKRLIMLVGIAVIVLGGGAAGAFMFLGSSGGETKKADEKSSEEAPEEEESEEAKKEDGGEEGGEGTEKEGEEAADKPADSSYGKSFPLKAFNLNLGNPLDNRFVRLEVSLEYKGDEKQKVELESRTPQLRDAVIDVTSRKTREFLLSPDGKDQLRLEIQNRINRYLKYKVEAVYITDILIE